ncbi:MAG: hypothetical protein ACI4V0_10550 [Lachnospiraceae bacterium]
MSFFSFVFLMLPYTIIAGLCLFVFVIFLPKHSIMQLELTDTKKMPLRMLFLYGIAFGLCLMSVLKILDIRILLVLIFIFLLFFDRTVFLKVDYALLGTFAGFFIFIGNIQQFTVFRNFLSSIVENHEILVAVLSSQIISNVPAALLLSGFSSD